MSDLRKFSDLETSFNAADQQMQAAADTTQAVQAQAADTSTTTATVDTTAVVDANAGAQAQAQVATQSIDEINSTSSFALSLGDEPAAAVQAATTQQAQAAATVAEFNWKEELKKLKREEVLQELGLNPFAIEIDQHIARGGKPLDYLSAKAVDWNQVSDADIAKDALRKQYPTFTPQEIERMYNRKYNFSEDADQDEKDDKLLMLKADAHAQRQRNIEESSKFKIPDTVPLTQDEAYKQWKQEQETAGQQYEQFVSYYNNHEATKTLIESKRVAINLGEGVPAFNFTIDRPELLTQALTDGGKTWQKLTSTPSGEPDVRKQQLITMFMFNPEKVLNDVFNYGQQMGVRSKIVGDGQNAQRPQAKVIPVTTNSDAQTVSVGKFGDRQR